MQPDPEYEVYNISGGEWAVIAIGIVFYFISLCGLGFVIYNRDYSPLKVKQIPLLTCNLLSGAIWWIGALAALRVLPQIGNPVFLLCDFWAIWVQLVFGLWLFSCTFIFRLWRLFVIVKLKRSAQSYRFYLSFFIFWGPALIYGIFASAFKVDGPVDYQGYFQCRFLGAAKYVVFVLTGIYILVILFFIIALRSISQKYLREYREIRNLLGATICFYIIYLVINAFNYNDMLWGRCVGAIVILFCGILAFWFIVGIPIYHCIFHREEYLKRFHEQVKNGISSSEKRSDRIENDHGHEASLGMSSQFSLTETIPS